MTADTKAKFISKLADTYDISLAARFAGITVTEAREILKVSIRAVDDAVLCRVLGTSAELTKKAIDEFSSIAFSPSEDCKISDKIRALEQLLRLIPDGGQESEPLTVVYDYK